MNDLGTHLALFALIGIAIVVVSTFYAEPDERKAWRSLPRRLAVFFVGCGLLALVVVACGEIFA